MSFDPFAPDALADPYPQYHAQRERAPVQWSERLRSWVLFRHDDVVAFFRDDERLSSDRSRAAKFRGPRSPEAMTLRTVASDPPAHAPVRTMLAASLNPVVRGIGPRVSELITMLLDDIERVFGSSALHGEVDIIGEFAYRLPITVIAEMLDVPVDDRERFQNWSHAVARGMDRFYSNSDANTGLLEMGAYFLQLVQARQDGDGDDLVRRLIRARHNDDRLSDLEVVAMCTALVFGGHETTVNLIGNGLLALLRDPPALARVRESPDVADAAIEELLRFDSPAQIISRTARTGFEWRGQAIKTGDAVVALLGAANRDPAVFDAPDRLDVTRSPNPHLAFGAGTHFCPGALLSRIEARAAIPALVRRFPRLRLGATPPTWRPTAVLRGLAHLPVRVD